MKKISIIPLYLVILLFASIACEDNRELDIPADQFAIINSGVKEISLFAQSESASEIIAIGKGGLGTLSGNVQLTIDESLVEDYNAKHSTNYKAMPTNVFSLDKTELHFDTDDTNDFLILNLNIKELVALQGIRVKEYVIPIKLTSTDAVEVNPEHASLILIPELKGGIRQGSGKILWSKKLQADLNISELHVTGGIAVTDDYLVINTRNTPSIYLDRKTGEMKGTMPNMGSIIGGLTNFYSTSDDKGNILVCNLAPNAGTFKIWKFKDVNAQPETLIDWSDSGNYAIGRKISVQGNVDKNAIITGAILGDGRQFARWQIKDGAVVSQTPEIISISGIESAWWNNADVVYTEAENPNSDYFVACYAIPWKLAWGDGKTNVVKAWGPEFVPNWIPNAVDYTVFNHCPYVVYNTVNPWNWGRDDIIHLFDASSESTISSPLWKSPEGVYGGFENGGQNLNGTGDVQFKVSDDGNYLYVYFMFTNGCVVCVQFDCLVD